MHPLWLPYENSLLESLAEFLGPKLNGHELQEYFPHKTPVECETQWQKVKGKSLIEFRYSIINDPSQWEISPINGMGSLPLVPFLNLCSFLTSKEVFKVLPLVCKHFNSIVSNYEIPLDLLEIKFYLDSEREMAIWEKRVLQCRRISITGFRTHSEDSYWTFVLKKLLNKLKPELEELTYWSEWHSDIAELVHSCPSLITFQLSLNGFPQSWSWDKKWTNPKVKRMYFSDIKLCQENVKNLLNVLPGLEVLEVRNSWTPVTEYDPEPVWEKGSRLTNFKGCFLLDQSQFTELESLDIQITSFTTLSKLIQLLPALGKLSLLILRLSWILARIDVNYHHYGPITASELLRLTITLGKVRSLKRLQLHLVKPYGSFVDDSLLVQLLLSLPSSIQHIEYRSKDIRRKI
jgi:hypothetical protein